MSNEENNTANNAVNNTAENTPNNPTNNQNNNQTNGNASTTTPQTHSEKENEHLAEVKSNKAKSEDNLNLPTYEEAVSFNSFVSNLETAGGNVAPNSSFYITDPTIMNQQQQHQHQNNEKPLHSTTPSPYLTQSQPAYQSYSPQQPQQQLPQQPPHSPQQPPKSPQQQKANSTYLQSPTYNAANVSLLDGKPSRPINSSSSPNISYTNPNTSFVQGQPVNPNASFVQGQPLQNVGVPTAPPSNTGSNVYPSAPAEPMITSPQSQPSNLPYPPPVQQGSYMAPAVVPAVLPAVAPGQYMSGQYMPPAPPFVKHRFDSKKPESETNQNFETCFDGEYPDMNGCISIGTGIIGSRKTQVKALGRENVIKSSIGLSIVDIRGARVLCGESRIVLDGSLGKLIIVVPKYISIVMEDQYCIGEVFSYRPTEIPVNESVQKGLPVIRIVVKNTVGDVNIVEEEASLNISADNLNNKIKKLRKEYGKKNNNNNNNNYNNNIIIIIIII